MNAIFEDIRSITTEIFQHLHNHPEVSWKEHKTTKYIQSILEKQGCRVRTFEDCPGVIGEIGS